MPKYISILRGINVGGHRKILMADLKILFEKLGYKNIVTYIQSGNVVFDVPRKSANQKIAEKISRAIAAAYDFEVSVLVRTADEFQQVLTVNPFLKDEKVLPEKLFVTFLASPPEPDKLEAIKAIQYPPDSFEIIGLEVYIYCPERYRETKLSNQFFERKLKVAATTRNWKTINKVVAIATDS